MCSTGNQRERPEGPWRKPRRTLAGHQVRNERGPPSGKTGHRDARCRAEAGRLDLTLTPAQRAEVERRVRDWLPTRLKQTSPAAELKLP